MNVTKVSFLVRYSHWKTTFPYFHWEIRWHNIKFTSRVASTVENYQTISIEMWQQTYHFDVSNHFNWFCNHELEKTSKPSRITFKFSASQQPNGNSHSNYLNARPIVMIISICFETVFFLMTETRKCELSYSNFLDLNRTN